jgi:hypothetical protein
MGWYFVSECWSVASTNLLRLSDQARSCVQICVPFLVLSAHHIAQDRQLLVIVTPSSFIVTTGCDLGLERCPAAGDAKDAVKNVVRP